MYEKKDIDKELDWADKPVKAVLTEKINSNGGSLMVKLLSLLLLLLLIVIVVIVVMIILFEIIIKKWSRLTPS